MYEIVESYESILKDVTGFIYESILDPYSSTWRPFSKSCSAGTDSRILRSAVYKVLSGDGVLIYDGLTLFHGILRLVDRDLSEYHSKNLTDQGYSFTVSAQRGAALGCGETVLH